MGKKLVTTMLLAGALTAIPVTASAGQVSLFSSDPQPTATAQPSGGEDNTKDDDSIDAPKPKDIAPVKTITGVEVSDKTMFFPLSESSQGMKKTATSSSSSSSSSSSGSSDDASAALNTDSDLKNLTSTEKLDINLDAFSSISSYVKSDLPSVTAQMNGSTDEDVMNGALKARQAAKSILVQKGLDTKDDSTQYACLYTLWNNESNWNYKIGNMEGSGAYGIAQALPAEKYATEGDDWKTNSVTQVKWGIGYIQERYKTPCDALEFWYSQSPHWY
ncbi:MAG: hypothetical protein QM571_02785 [Micrococcaceae bacterium]